MPSLATIGAVVFQLLVTTTTLSAAAPTPIALPGCPESCGGIQVPYPFGIGDGCSYHGFNLTCDDEAHHHQTPPKLFMATDNGTVVQVLNISLPDGTVRVRSKLSQSSIAGSSSSSSNASSSRSDLPADGPFTVSSASNWLVAFGCNIVADLTPYGNIAEGSSCAATCPLVLRHRALPYVRWEGCPLVHDPGHVSDRPKFHGCLDIDDMGSCVRS